MSTVPNVNINIVSGHATQVKDMNDAGSRGSHPGYTTLYTQVTQHPGYQQPPPPSQFPVQPTYPISGHASVDPRVLGPIPPQPRTRHLNDHTRPSRSLTRFPTPAPRTAPIRRLTHLAPDCRPRREPDPLWYATPLT